MVTGSRGAALWVGFSGEVKNRKGGKEAGGPARQIAGVWWPSLGQCRGGVAAWAHPHCVNFAVDRVGLK
jgi:hypothetical protein